MWALFVALASVVGWPAVGVSWDTGAGVRVAVCLLLRGSVCLVGNRGSPGLGLPANEEFQDRLPSFIYYRCNPCVPRRPAGPGSTPS